MRLRGCAWVFTTHGRPGNAVCTDLRRLCRIRMQQPDACRAVSHASARQLLLRRWRTMLSCANMMGYTSTLIDIIEGCVSFRPPSPLMATRFYELQSSPAGRA